MSQLVIAVAQLNPTVGDIVGNIAKLRTARATARELGAHILMTTELYLSAYPPEDLVLKPAFMAVIEGAVSDLIADTEDGGPAVLLGTPWRVEEKVFNACLLLDRGKISATVMKRDLPNYGPFDEKRIFTAGPLPVSMDFRGFKLGVTICEDIWTPETAIYLKQQGADILLVPNGSPYETGKTNLRHAAARLRVSETGLPLIYANQVGGQDELIYDGATFALDDAGMLIGAANVFSEDTLLINCNKIENKLSLKASHHREAPSRESADYQALMLGLQDYTVKNGFNGVILGLSGGVDSALAAILATDALGADKVWAVMLPSPYTSAESLVDAKELVQKLGCRYDIISIAPEMQAIDQSLAPLFDNCAVDLTEENIQARCRGLILMALSNKFGAMVISTGNKSEIAVGYATLYGDMCGGFAVLKDLYKTQLYKVARWRNAHKPPQALGPSGAVMPERILTKAPTAELRPNQTDQDSLPPYPELDAILEALVEGNCSIDDVVTRGYDHATVGRVAAMLDRAEYKRRQAPPGPKITRRNFGKDRRYPITHKFRAT